MMDTDLNDLPAWVVQRMKDKDAEIYHLRAQVEALTNERKQAIAELIRVFGPSCEEDK